MPLGRELGLGQSGIVLDGDPAPPRKGAQHPQFSAHFVLARSPISRTAELLLHRSPQSVSILYNGPRFPSLKIVPFYGNSDPIFSRKIFPLHRDLDSI